MKNRYEIIGDICRIYFNDGGHFVIDADNFEMVSERTWFRGKRGYPVSHTSRRSPDGHKTETLHKFLLRPGKGFDVDHISGDKMDNRRNNVRICSHQQNMFNQRLKTTNSSGYSGVSYSKNAGKYEAYINRDGRKIHLGLFMSAREAAEAREVAAVRLFGEYAKLNMA